MKFRHQEQIAKKIKNKKGRLYFFSRCSINWLEFLFRSEAWLELTETLWQVLEDLVTLHAVYKSKVSDKGT